ncbi:acyltransferase [Ginsengibacter hankyongi]|uniref:Acyltransferase n=1 Tax=Ginsengibacter hankyongi TaxID=2607284 RepID=A0A5J5IG42_9BACT|nr:acyltransferase [Ginsengibacter hankyongi]KAA9039240.1 acyltransferase [Ginsengibacter hankyongi]
MHTSNTLFAAPKNNIFKGTSKPIYLPGLNGLRAIASIAVVISHTTLALSQFGLNSKIFGTDMDGNPKGLDLAGDGVSIFFTLSGFLITFLLLKEKELGHLKIKDFYIRRLLRIWPLYYLYLFASIVTAIIFGIAFNKFSVPFYIFLAANVPFILGKALPFLAHYWSLGVEEQFYLFFPQLAKQPNKRLLKIAIILMFILLSLKFLFWILARKFAIELPFLAISVTRFNIMLTGVIGAILYYNKTDIFIKLATHKITQFFSWLCIFLIAINKFHIASVIDQDLIAMISVFLIVGQITKRNHIINLENKPCDFIGKISYGIYVIHPLLIFFYLKLLGRFNSDSVFNYLIIYFLIISTAIIVAYISYEFYEKKFLKMKAKFTTIKSSNTKALLQYNS